ncbi:cyanophycin synthetase [Vaginisenegalia massiliensis]|uniref:cyanophycin synthetase n=1 Tax=Vaginisenegalia massiliensis TaxID=2058294 RepID=UPI0019D071F3|nr:cyanophycin synthetase [Vaginisenegalia massiliensis]
MMKIVESRALRGPNYYHRLPIIFMALDLQELEDKPSHLVPSLLANLQSMMPSLYEHTCSPKVKGGFFQRVQRGTWAGHIAEHIALELQHLIGHDVTFGKTYTMSPKGHYHMVFRYRNEAVGLRAGQMAVEMVNRLYQGQVTDIEPLLAELRKVETDSKLGPSTQSIVDAAHQRGIPTTRLNNRSYVRLGNGKYQRKIEATMMDDTSALGVSIAGNKERTKEILAQHGIPVPQGKAARSCDEALAIAKRIGYPVVLKPLSGNHGRGVILNIQDEDELRQAYKQVGQHYKKVIIEQYLMGSDFRLLVINYKFQAAALRCPAMVIGDGQSTIADLVDQLNQDPRRGQGHENFLTQVNLDDESLNLLASQGYQLNSVLPPDEKVYLKATANISSGGTAIDVTDMVHPSIKLMAERMARIIGLNVMGIDLLAESLDQPLSQQRAGVVEVNASPGFRMHLQPSQGQARDIAQPVVDMLFPEGQPHSIPVCAVTGTNGKTTTTRLIAHILARQGKTVGHTTTDSVIINNTTILQGDYSGPAGAEAIFADHTVDCAVLEVARGGLLRRGLGFKHCDVGVLLNVSSDHLGFGGIDTLDQLARLKSVVTNSVKKEGYAVFNAEDPRVVSRAAKSFGQPIFFAKDPQHPVLVDNLAKGYFNVTLNGHDVILQKPLGDVAIGKVQEFPITFDGQASFNIENILAAVAATYAMGASEEEIRAGLISFSPSIGQSPGRMNVIDVGDFKVVIDYGHNPAAIRATGHFFRSIMPGRKIRVASGVGNRRTEDIKEYGQAVAGFFDHVVLCDPCSRIRPLGETMDIVKEGLLEAGLGADVIDEFIDEKAATHHALAMAQAGDLVVIQAHDIDWVTQTVLELKEAYLEQEEAQYQDDLANH